MTKMFDINLFVKMEINMKYLLYLYLLLFFLVYIFVWSDKKKDRSIENHSLIIREFPSFLESSIHQVLIGLIV